MGFVNRNHLPHGQFSENGPIQCWVHDVSHKVNYWETPTWVANRSLTPWHKKINSHLELGIPSPDHHPVAPSYQATHVEFLPLEQCWAGTERENAGFGLIIFLCPSLSLLFVCEYFLNLIAPTVFTVYLIWENQ